MYFRKAIKRFYFHTIKGYRPITVVLRHKISPEQEKYLHTHKHFLNLKSYSPWENKNKDKQIFLEIGFGGGEHLLKLVQENKQTEVVGVELYTPGVVKVLQKIDELHLKNLFVSTCDARDILKIISKESLSRIYILFPDPWTKKRQFSRRLVNRKFLQKCVSKLGTDGQIVLATDWEEYAVEIENVLQELKGKHKLKIKKFEDSIVQTDERFKNIVNTNFANRAKREGRKITIFILEKTVTKKLFVRFFR
jgi:tRNA (guanine-N7-)-methyltransferase